jgi:MoxR-like ATPase
MNNIELVEKLHLDKERLFEEISKIIIGQKDVLEHLFIAILCQGHVLLEGVPGLAKTLLINTLSDAMDLKFNRIQFTPDLMPSDITGTEIIENETGKRNFKFFKGPIFSNIVLADEINRTPPKTQAALLEAMQEHKVTAGGESHLLEEPFFVLATQNPIEQEGTYPLPEAQLDRFMLNIIITYPSINEEIDIVKSTTFENDVDINQIIRKEDLFKYQKLIKNVPVADNVIEYAVNFVNNTRNTENKWLEWGAGPRASMYLVMAAKAKAILNNQTTPDIGDIQSMIHPVLRHRIIPNFNAEADGVSRDDILNNLINENK